MDLCYDECPQHTFAKLNSDELDEAVTLSEIDAAAAISTPDGNDLPSTGKSSINQDDPLLAAERRRRSSESSTSTLLLTPRQSRICSSCDKSCLRCYGPNASQCSTCYPGNQLRKLLQTNETYCYAYVVRSTVVDVSNPANAQLASDAKIQYMNWSTALLVIAVVVSLVGVGVAGGMVYNRRAAKAEAYTRVALIAEDDSDEEQEVEVFKARLHYPSDVLEYHDELQPNQLPRESLGAALQDELHAQLMPE